MTDWTSEDADAADPETTGALDAAPDPASEPGPDPASEPRPEIDLDRIQRDLDGVEVALQRLDAGTYWSDEVTGEPLPDELLDTDPTARRNA